MIVMHEVLVKRVNVMKHFPTHTGRMLTSLTFIIQKHSLSCLLVGGGGGGGVTVGWFLTDGKVKCKRSVGQDRSVGVRG